MTTDVRTSSLLRKAISRLVAAAVLCAATVCAGCSPAGNSFSSYEFLPQDGWRYGDTIVFRPEMADSTATGELTLSLRHTNDYAYSNLWLEVSVRDSSRQFTDTINVVLADRLGRWLGRGIGTDFQSTDTIAPRIRMNRDTEIRVRHIMRVDNLTDVEQIGIAFTEEK